MDGKEYDDYKMRVKRNRPILFDTAELEKIRRPECGGGRGEE